MKYYTVRVINPPAFYPNRYFPRHFRYKKDAINCAKKVVDEGAERATIESPTGGDIYIHAEDIKSEGDGWKGTTDKMQKLRTGLPLGKPKQS